ncbi:hypothetical protein [Ferrovibrio sp.]|uniref:hypothetical protein n=1 Tax=Ferrovibrio sp. TaxID=1917215 RepID=UPI00311FE01D
MIMSLAMTAFGLGTLCILLYRLASYGLPLLVAVGTGHLIYSQGGGILGSVLGGGIAGGIALVVSYAIFSATQSSRTRALLALAYGLPAAYAGYQIGVSLMRIGTPDSFWLYAVGAISGLASGITAVRRLIGTETAQRAAA